MAGPQGRRVTWIDFHVARTTVDDLPSLTQFQGEKGLGRVRARWPVGILALRGTLLDHEAIRQGREKVGYAWNSDLLGKAVLVGLVPPEDLGHQEEPFVAGMTVGAEGLRAGLVLVSSDGTLSSIGEDQTLETAGLLTLRSRYASPNEVPDSIPIY